MAEGRGVLEEYDDYRYAKLDRQPTTSEGSNQRVRCREDHVARQPNEISCPAGAIVEVVRRDIISGWWLVCYCDQVGKIPSMKLALDDVLWRNQTATSAGPVSSQISPRLDSHRGSPHLSRLRSRILTSRDIQPQQSSSLSVSRSDENLHQRQRGSQATLGTGTEVRQNCGNVTV
ncbi:uncharacterized protein LOC134184763 [Corticium candelabrum]|uniref:uncharacterized protein LOC134184763 n=1 Tax=Corticium candelabrum TaxID=121492 RepID=UPI002E3695AE|nr:uncharacterized protein LOC134184763 [Corticium candelabrum]